jgi:hypothetical protein
MVTVGMLVSLGAVYLHPEQEDEPAEEPLLIDQEPVMDAPELVESPFSDGENRRLEPDLDEQIEIGESYIPD